MPRRRRQEPSAPQEPGERIRPIDPRPQVDLNQVVAYNVRAARELRGWTQEEFAERLEYHLGTRLTQASISAIERAWDGDRRREFDAHELLIFAMVFDLPMLWFLLPPKGDHRLMRGTTRQVDELLIWLLGRPEKLEPLYERLRELGMHDPTEAQLIVEKLTGQPAESRAWSYKERRKEMLLALLDNHADEFDTAVEELGKWVDHLRQAGIRGFIAEHTWDDDFTRSGRPAAAVLDETAPHNTTDETAPDGRRRRGRGSREEES
ncbi:MAG TPA: helix-turn-helix transcriptional regulator [Acidimicrobiia bacterium]|nr:helix-turn-helix transcriptional regulator [Acidimicrobiia bacterium]